MNYELSYREKHKLNESDLTVAQRTLHFIAENMRMEKSISEDGYKHFQQAIEALKQEPCEKFESTKDHIYKLAGDYKCWDNRLTHDEALELCHILEQESILDKIRNEIDTQDKWLAQAGYTAYNVDIAFNSIKRVIAESEGE